MLISPNVFRTRTQRLKLSLPKIRTKTTGTTNRVAEGRMRSRRRTILLLMIGIATASIFTSLAYGIAYSDGQNAINGLSVY